MNVKDLNFTYLKFFLDTVENKSFTKAAEINFVSRPAISQGISRLEIWYGKKLFLHRKREFQLTKDGGDFYKNASSAYKQFTHLLFNGSNKLEKFNIECTSSLSSLLIKNLKKLKSVPENFNLKVGNTLQLQKMLKNEEISIAFFIDSNQKTDLTTKILQSGRFALFSKSGRIEQLTATSEERSEVRNFKKWNKSKKKKLKIVTIESWSLAKEMALNLPFNCLIPDFIADEKLKIVSTPGFSQLYYIKMSFLSNEKLSEEEMHFINEVKYL